MSNQDGQQRSWVGRTLGRRTRSGRPIWLAVLAALVVGAAVLGLMHRQQQPQSAAQSPDAPTGLVLPEQGRYTSLAAVGPIRGLMQPCTGWLVAPGVAADAMSAAASGSADTTASPGASAAPGVVVDGPAYAVTAAQCVGVTDSNEVVSGRKLTGVTLGLNAFARVTSAAQSTQTDVPATEVVWASARWLNLAVLRLDARYEDLRAQGIYPISVAAQPDPGTALLAAAVPVADLPQDQQYLRVARCKAGNVVRLLAGPWVWQDSQATDCVGMLQGAIGGVAFNPAGDVLGMVVASTIGASTSGGSCSAARPCEVVEDNVAQATSASYLQPVDLLADCFPGGQFRLGGECVLEDPQTVVPATAVVSAAQPGASVAVELGAGVTGEVANKYGLLASTDCQDPLAWGRPMRARDWRMTMQLPTQAGWVLGCVGSPSQPTPVVVQVDSTPPDPSNAELQITEAPGGREVAPVLDPPEYSEFLWTSGQANLTDCAIAEGYQKYQGKPALIEAEDLPATVCLIAVDSAGNRSTPVGRQVQ